MRFRCCAAALASLLFVTTDGLTTETALPANLLVQAPFIDIVEGMHRTSSTFRSQCRLIRGNSRLVISVEQAAEGQRAAFSRAECEMRRYQFGRIQATVRLWSLTDAPKLIAHELEHVLEFTERLNYRAIAITQPGTVWRVGHTHFESRRAIETGERVADEMSRNQLARE